LSLGFLILLSLALGLGAWLAFVWSVRSGQYDDPEGPKYRMMEDEEDSLPTDEGARDPPVAPGRRGPRDLP
jgi:cbb3-type cytochrome oxidase maturation protein